MAIRNRSTRPPPAHRGPTAVKIVALTAVFVVLLSVGIGLYLRSEAVAVTTDKDSLCPTSKPPSEIVVTLLDLTSRLSEPQLIAIKTNFERLRNGLPRFALLDVYAVDAYDDLGSRIVRQVVRICSPGTGEDLSRWYQNPDLARKRWRQFAARVDGEFDLLLHREASSTSAILEAIQSAALQTFGQPEFDSVPKSLVVVSDLLHHVPGKLSQYKDYPSFSQFSKTAYYNSVRARLDGVTVTTWYLVRRDNQNQWTKHIEWWQSFFAAQGAIVQSVDPIWGEQ